MEPKTVAAIAATPRAKISAAIWAMPHYAGWYQRLLGLAEAGWLPVVLRDYNPVSYDRVSLDDVRPKEWHVDKDETPILPLPPPGELQQDYTG